MDELYRWLRKQADYHKRSAASYRGKYGWGYWEYRQEGAAHAYENVLAKLNELSERKRDDSIVR